MDDKLHELELKINDHHNEIGSLQRRMDNFENLVDEIREMNVTSRLMVQRQDTMDRKIDGIIETVDELERKPKDNWNKASWLVISLIITGTVSSVINAISTIINSNIIK